MIKIIKNTSGVENDLLIDIAYKEIANYYK